MATIVRANCPGCQTTLRIPSDWADRPVKCKKCGSVVRAVATTATNAPVAVVAQPVAYTPVEYTPQATYTPQIVAEADVPMAFEPSEVTKKYRGKKSGKGIYFFLAFGLLLVGGIVAGVMKRDELQTALKNAMNKSDGQTTPTTELKTTSPTGGSSALINASKRFPRRMLFLSVTKYLYCNTLAAGNAKNEDMVSIAARRLAYQWKVPMDKDNEQLFILQDAGAKARPMLKPSIEQAVDQFCETSRAQDRVLIYFGGHAVVVDGKAYLVPVDGDLTDAATMIPLEEFWAKVKACPAQQKVVIFDVCRLSENGDKIRPGSEAMSETLEKLLLAAPAGVQVLTSASAGKNALEFRASPQDAEFVGGSLLLSAFIDLAGGGKVKAAKDSAPEEALPLAAWFEAAKASVAKVSSLTGKPDPAPKWSSSETIGTVAYNAEEAPAKRVEFMTPAQGMAPADVAKIIAPIRTLPPYKGELKPDDAIEGLIPFAESLMKDYKPDATTIEEIKKDGAKYPVRKAAIESLELIAKVWKSSDSNSTGLITEISAATNDTFKKFIIREQETPARITEELETKITQIEKLMDKLDEEPSKYWRVTYLYALAQLKARLAFMSEYNLALGSIRTDNIPKVDEAKGQAGLILVSTEKMKSKKDVKDLAEAANELFTKIADEHKGTPWAIQAKRYRVISLGLEWKPYVRGKSSNLD
jgi:Caspase domain